jgi:hypothetical protein
MLKEMLKGRLRRSLSLNVRMTERITREREMVKEFTLEDGASNDTWIGNQVRLKAQL